MWPFKTKKHYSEIPLGWILLDDEMVVEEGDQVWMPHLAQWKIQLPIVGDCLEAKVGEVGRVIRNANVALAKAREKLTKDVEDAVQKPPSPVTTLARELEKASRAVQAEKVRYDILKKQLETNIPPWTLRDDLPTYWDLAYWICAHCVSNLEPSKKHALADAFVAKLKIQCTPELLAIYAPGIVLQDRMKSAMSSGQYGVPIETEPAGHEVFYEGNETACTQAKVLLGQVDAGSTTPFFWPAPEEPAVDPKPLEKTISTGKYISWLRSAMHIPTVWDIEGYTFDDEPHPWTPIVPYDVSVVANNLGVKIDPYKPAMIPTDLLHKLSTDVEYERMDINEALKEAFIAGAMMDKTLHPPKDKNDGQFQTPQDEPAQTELGSSEGQGYTGYLDGPKAGR